MDLTLLIAGPDKYKMRNYISNIILGRERYQNGFSDPITTCELKTGVLKDGQTICVINTPGFWYEESDLLGDFKKCSILARNGIHGILFIITSGTPKEERKVAIRNLQKIFGKDICSYTIPLFWNCTGDSYTIQFCEGRRLSIPNQLDGAQRSQLVEDVLSLVKNVTTKSGGKLFMTLELKLHAELSSRLEQMEETNATAIKEQTTERINAVEARLRDATTSLEGQLGVATLMADKRSEKYFEEATSGLIQQMTQRLEAVELRVKDATTRLEQQLLEAEAARLKADERTRETQKNSDEQVQTLKDRLDRAEKDRSEAMDVTTRLEQQLAEAEAARLKADERTQETQKNSDEQMQKLREVFQRAQMNSDEQMQKLKEGFDRAQDRSKAILDVTTKLEQQLAESEAVRLKADERIQEEQKNSNEQIQEVRERLEIAVRRSEATEEFGISSFHVYDPSTYLLQSGIK